MKYEAIFAPRDTDPLIEPRSLPTYAILGFGVFVSAVLVPVMGFSISPSVWPIFLTWPFVAFSGMLLRRVRHPKGAAFLESTALVYGHGFATLLALFPLTALSAPLADNTLASIDHALGFNWTAYAWAVAPSIDPLIVAYKSFNWQPLLIIACLAASGRTERLWAFTLAATASLVITTAIYPFMPALGAFAHYGIQNYPIAGRDPLRFGHVILMLKDGYRIISPDLFVGFISFPSYHAAAATLFVWAAWPFRWLRFPILLLNIAVCAAAIVVGGHYLVDIIGGIAVASVSVFLALRVPGDYDKALTARATSSGERAALA